MASKQPFPYFARSRRSFPYFGRSRRSLPFGYPSYRRFIPYGYTPSSSWNDDLMAVRRAARIKREICSRRSSFGDTDDGNDHEIVKTSMNNIMCEVDELSFDGYCSSRGLSLTNLEESERLNLEMLWKEVNIAKTQFQCKQSELDAKICSLIGT